jgi:hypothetical protein
MPLLSLGLELDFINFLDFDICLDLTSFHLELISGVLDKTSSSQWFEQAYCSTIAGSSKNN